MDEASWDARIHANRSEAYETVYDYGGKGVDLVIDTTERVAGPGGKAVKYTYYFVKNTATGFGESFTIHGLKGWKIWTLEAFKHVAQKELRNYVPKKLTGIKPQELINKEIDQITK